MNTSSSDPSAVILARSIISIAKDISSRQASLTDLQNSTEVNANSTLSSASNGTASLFTRALPVTSSSVPALQATCLALLLLASLFVASDLLWGLVRLAKYLWSCEGGQSKYNQRSKWSAWRPLYALFSLSALACNSAAILHRLILSNDGERNAQILESAAFGMGALVFLFLIGISAPTKDRRTSPRLVKFNNALLALALVSAALGSTALLVLTSRSNISAWSAVQASLAALLDAANSDIFGGACSDTDPVCSPNALTDRLQALANAIEKVDYVKGGILGVLLLLLLLVNLRAQRNCTLSARSAEEEASRLAVRLSQSRRGSAFSFTGPHDEMSKAMRCGPADRFTDPAHPARIAAARLARSRRSRRPSELLRSDSGSSYGSIEKQGDAVDVPGGFKEDWFVNMNGQAPRMAYHGDKMDRAGSWDARELRPGDLTSLSNDSNHATLDFGAGLGIIIGSPGAALFSNPYDDRAELQRRRSALSNGTTNGIKLDTEDLFGAELARLFGSNRAQDRKVMGVAGSERASYRNHHHNVQEKSSKVQLASSNSCDASGQGANRNGQTNHAFSRGMQEQKKSSMRMSRQSTLRSTRSAQSSLSCASLGTVMSDVPILPAWEAYGLYVSHIHCSSLTNGSAALASSKHVARRRRLRLDLILALIILAILAILQFLKFAAGDDLALGLRPTLQLVGQCSTAVIFAVAHALVMVVLIARGSGSTNLSLRDDDEDRGHRVVLA
ncbi:hypothetical protein IE81DRAFT_346121 [Ceraceosorus guamensis]|uniref:Transmembrane protein n=1 Tax=Ceraceosorus guamensis TaxID=1522189 RepID=A0A316W4B1_9BASI|nr:hypothetical protein IE81DRAFT_346121 [Ceraceosorus guamensis]PWN43958.1 hypothetical protein IE81DRAFT_346121 [Ceraceosorus guamensis]